MRAKVQSNVERVTERVAENAFLAHVRAESDRIRRNALIPWAPPREAKPSRMQHSLGGISEKSSPLVNAGYPVLHGAHAAAAAAAILALPRVSYCGCG